MKNKYGEPWVVDREADMIGLAVRTQRGLVEPTEDAPEYTSRIIACVNAMAGVEDPAAFVKEAKKVGTTIAISGLSDGSEPQAQNVPKPFKQEYKCDADERRDPHEDCGGECETHDEKK